MKKIKLIAVAIGIAAVSHQAHAQSGLSEAISGGKVYANLNLRYEAVDQSNALREASALTLRTRLGYETGAYKGFSVLLELEDSRIVAGQDDYSVAQTGFNPGQYSEIADPETTELDQGFLQYKSKDDTLTIKLGRQVITHDEHRFVGHVGWRQDRQTFDAGTISYRALDNVTLNYGYINQRNRIFAEFADTASKDHLLNAAYETSFGTVTGYAYLLEVDNAPDNGIDTFGINFKGKKTVNGTPVLYALEFASQESDSGAASFNANYLLVEGGVEFPKVTARLGYEVLGSDNGDYGFSTPLATLHKFNGWSDQFLGTPAQGLQDVYLALGGSVKKMNWVVAYHNFSADESSANVNDFGTEIDLQVTRKFASHYTVGLKYAAYNAGDTATGKVDTDKLWAWFTLGF